jgi:ribonuclease J
MFKDRKSKLRFVALSGTTGVTENLYIYEFGQDMIVVDCGVGFPDPDMFGVDLVIPDMSYIAENRDRLRGIVITHGHEDHIGALPFLLDKVNVPVYASQLTAGFIKDKLEDYGLKDYKVITVDPERDVIKLGVFKLTPFRVSHSVPDTVGYCIDTPEGNVFHVSDYKFDWTPVDGKPFNVSKAAALASQGVLMLASDSLGSTNAGYTESEREIEGRFEKIIEKASGQVFLTTISSNISRMQQAINVADRLGRKVCLIGRSVVTKAEIARNFAYLKYDNKLVVSPKHARKLKKDKILYIISGSYGQPGSALYKVAMGEHPYLKVEEGDTIIFSGDPAPPGSKTNVDFLVDRFFELETDVHYYDMQEDLHVSGHGSRQDIFMLFGIVRPKYYVPIGGTIRHMRAYKIMAKEMGASDDQVFEMMPGDSVEFSGGMAKRGGKVKVENVLVDGLGVGDVGNVVLRDRKKLSQDGIAIVILQYDTHEEKLISSPEIISRGFVFEKRTKDFLVKTGQMLGKRLSQKKVVGAIQLKNETADMLERFFYKETGRRPMVLPVVVEI